jgi:signal transduction histidine kinase
MAIAAPSGAWLLVECGVSAPVALPVPRQACIGLARAVLFSGVAVGAGSTAGAEQGVAEKMLLLTDGDPAVAAWLACAETGGRQDGRLVQLMAETLVVADDLQAGRAVAARFLDPDGWRRSCEAGARPRAGEWPQRVAAAAGGVEGPGQAAAVEPADEALLLREAVRAAVALTLGDARFEAAVADSRLAAMRELAYGAGHEINNPLANIATRAQSLLLEEHDAERRRKLSTIVDQAFRARDMIGGLMLFARPPKPRADDLDVGAVVTAVLESAQPLAASRSACLDFSPSPRPIVVRVDRAQVEEALRAVVTNALEAVAPGGRVVLAVGGTDADGAVDDMSMPTCDIVVSDDGHGMDEETLRRAFDPFFSGREAGRGAGLGLSKAWRLIGVNGGRVAIDSRIGHGTRVTVTLPRR